MSDIYYGGQAVIEGVMMRGKKVAAVAVRNPKGEIVVHEEVLTAAVYTKRWSRAGPLVRGATMLWDAMVSAPAPSTWSADVSLSDDEDVEFTGPVAWITVALSLAVAIGLFSFLPAAGGKWLETRLGVSPITGAFIEGFYPAGAVPDLSRAVRPDGRHSAGIPVSWRRAQDDQRL